MLAEKKNAVIRSFNGTFGAGFTHYTTEAGERVKYPDKSWSAIKGRYVVAERQDGTKIAVTAKTLKPDHGFIWIGEANQWNKISLKPGEFTEVRGMIGFVKDGKDVEALKSLSQNSVIPPEKKAPEYSKGDMVASPLTAGKDGFPKAWPTAMVVRKGTGWVRPDTTDTWKGDDNLSFTASAGFDADYLYLRADVKDSVFRQQNSGSEIWSGDCVQVAFDPLSEKTLTDNYILIGFTATDRPTVWCWHHPDSKYRNADLSEYCRIRGTRSAAGQLYEIAIPWKLLKPFTIDQGKIGFNMVVLDDDGLGVKHWMGITDGIAGGKDPGFYRPLFFSNPEKVMLAGKKDPRPPLVGFQCGFNGVPF